MKNKRIISIIAILILILGISRVYASSLNDLKNEQKGINERIKEKQSEISEIEGKQKSIADEIFELDKKIDEVNKEVKEAEEQLIELQKDIKVTEEELEVAEKDLDEKTELFNKRIRVMYMNGDVGYLEMLLSSKDVKDFLSRKDVLKSIAEYDKELLKFMTEQKDIIEEKKVKLESQRASVETTKSNLLARKEEFDEVSREKSDLMNRLQEDLESLEKEYDSLNKYAKELDSKIFNLQTVSGPYTGGRMSWPVPGSNTITSNYGYRVHPVFKTKKLHTGLDISAGMGTNIVAAQSGKVIYSGWLGSYGKTVMIDHGGGIVTLYAHTSSILVSKGQGVSQGQAIARVGTTGVSTGPHLHFEVRENGSYVDPLKWLKGN